MRDVWLIGGVCALLAVCQPIRVAAVTPCPAARNCAGVEVQGPAGPVDAGGTILVRVELAQGANDQQPGGLDDVAALTLSLGIPGLQLADCSAPGADGLNPSFALSASEPGRYRAVVQNLTCGSRPSCLCPPDGKARDGYVNLVLVGAPDAGSVRSLPSGGLLDVALRVPADAVGQVPLHLYSALDAPGTWPLPAAAALLSIADTHAAELTIDTGTDTLNVRLGDGMVTVVQATTPSPTASATATLTPPPTATADATPTVSQPPITATATATATATVTPLVCVGDCDHMGSVTVNELIAGVSITLGSLPLSSCPAFDCRGTGQVDVSCLIAGVNAALDGCPGQSSR